MKNIVEVKNRWTIKAQPEQKKINDLARELNVQPLIASLLIQRGIESKKRVDEFFHPKLSALHDPFLMKDMDKAVARIQTALNNGEKILVYSDYDVDGTTGVALVYTFLRSQNASCEFYIPDRYAEGYGISFAGIDFAKQGNYS